MTKTVSQIGKEMADREAIRDCLYRYCRGIDQMDGEVLASAYWPGAMDYHTGFTGTVEEFVEWALPRLAVMEQNMHMIGNILIRLDGARPERFSEMYEDLLKEIRTTSPGAMIYASIGPMLSSEDQDAAMAAIQRAVSARLLQGDRQVRTLRFSSQPDTGCDGHPGMITHSQMAKMLEKRIREDMKWQAGH